MADTKLSDLSSGDPPAANDLVYIARAGASKKATVLNPTDTVAGVLMPALGNGKIYVGKTGSAVQAVSPSADVSAISNAGAFTIAAKAVTNAKMADVGAHTYKGNNTGSTAAPADITSTQLTADLNLATDLLQGLAPATTDGKILVGKTGAALQAVSPSADVASISNAGAVTLATVNSDVGSFTNASITVNGKGLVTAASTGAGGSGISIGLAYAIASGNLFF